MKTVEIILKTYFFKKKNSLCGPWVRFSNSSSWFSTTGCMGYGVFCLSLVTYSGRKQPLYPQNAYFNNHNLYTTNVTFCVLKKSNINKHNETCSMHTMMFKRLDQKCTPMNDIHQKKGTFFYFLGFSPLPMSLNGHQ